MNFSNNSNAVNPRHKAGEIMVAICQKSYLRNYGGYMPEILSQDAGMFFRCISRVHLTFYIGASYTQPARLLSKYVFNTLFIQYQSVICRPTNHTAGRPQAEIRTRDGRSRGRDSITTGPLDHHTSSPRLLNMYIYSIQKGK